ncbi:MAG: DUF3536 domain-containing protein [Acidobacteriota bacterium]
MNRYVCVHGHFYQPPRESPWLESVEPQESAYPYHDWNERITAECFAPNASSRILDQENRIVQIVNNYSRISFNFGPTLLSWMELKARDTYQAILDADRQSLQKFSGHGCALAQAYNHVILPLASKREKRIQVLWGIRDFERRFQRRPEGMWLPEMAVDLESLETLAESGIQFTILAPHQARRIRKRGEEGWRSVEGSAIDITRPYRLELPSGGSITLFFYDGSIAQAVAFGGLLRSGEDFAQRLLDRFSDTSDRPQLVHIATDGETYGHHHRFGEMALSYALDSIESRQLAKLTNYGEYLQLHPPSWQVEIVENTSWSCIHGLERWRRDCGCQTGSHPGWNQAWRRPLRDALEGLRDSVEKHFEREAGNLLKDPRKAFEEYIEVILDRSPRRVDAFLKQHFRRSVTKGGTIRALRFMEMLRYSTLMFTSCAWFFDDISGLECRQALQFAGRVIELAQELFDEKLEHRFVNGLKAARSNVPRLGNGKSIYLEFGKGALVDLLKVGAHFALSSLFEDYGQTTQVFCYSVQTEDYQSARAGRARLAVGKVRITSNITRETKRVTCGAIHLGDHNLMGGVREFRSGKAYQALVDQTQKCFGGADFPGVIQLIDRHFGKHIYSLDSLFADEQQKILEIILDATVSEVEASFSRIYERHTPLMRYLENLGIALPRAFELTAEFVLKSQLRRALQTEEPDPKALRAQLVEATRRRVRLDTPGLGYNLQLTCERIARRALGPGMDLLRLSKLEDLLGLLDDFPLQVNLRNIQNLYYQRLQELSGAIEKLNSGGTEEERLWLRRFLALGQKLSIRV